jgi:hypothetical protein
MNLSNCRITQNEKSHILKWNGRFWGHVYATDIACEKGKSFSVKAPNFYDTYKVAEVWELPTLGNYIVLSYWKEKFVFGHTKSQLKAWEIVESWKEIGKTNISGMSKGMHLHFERWRWEENISFFGTEVNSHFSDKLLTQRNWKKELIIYMTTYNWWVKAQNDSTPCIGASGRNGCKLLEQWIRPVAITSDIRKKYWLKFWQKVKLENIKTWKILTAQIEDEMNIRYRRRCIKKNWYCIKGDIWIKARSKERFDGAYKILKL